MLYGDVGYHDYEGVTTGLEERPRIVKALGDRNHLILRNHGLLAVGGTVAQCFHRLWTLQRACEIQLAADAGAGPNREIAVPVLERVPATRLTTGGGAKSGGVAQLMFDAMLRRAGISRDAL
jgi:ribulose-5-phosphate 4-epimerase/fuculose-1-phosphate aldolase